MERDQGCGVDEAMIPNKKLKAGIFSFACCEGCQLEILDLWKKLVEILKFTEIEYFKMAQEKNEVREMDIAIIEGSITTKEEVARIKDIRQKSSVLITIGECSSSGGIPAMRNEKRIKLPKDVLDKTTAVNRHVKVDYHLRGCPINKNEFLSLITGIVYGKKPLEVDHPVCMECVMKENDCLLLKGKPCMGPVTCGGCNALCPSIGSVCEGCRGIMKDAGLRQFKEKMNQIGISPKKQDNMIKRFASDEIGKVKEEQKKYG
jgi:coenzyme F420-reducing hydrogenase gamma subunit